MNLPWIKEFLKARRAEAETIQADWSVWWQRPSEAEVERAAQLASQGFLTSVAYMRMEHISIRDIPWEQMKKLLSIVTNTVHMNNIEYSEYTDQLVSILATVKCQVLGLGWYMELSDTETRALVTAMRDGVKNVDLEDVTLDIEEFTKYDGQGHCSELIGVWVNKMPLYREWLRSWAADKGWRVTVDNDAWLGMTK